MQANRKSYIAGELLKEVRLDKDQSNLEISSISSDSRNILDKSIFFAIKGTRWNGNNFIGEAFQKGASLILSDQKKFENKNVIYFSNLRDVHQNRIDDHHLLYQKNFSFHREIPSVVVKDKEIKRKKRNIIGT